ncbi:thiamine phosphate synthase [Thermosynechococcus sp. M55_K2018_012]|uniref:thiamine phosphate synthase n=1 Tax=Thermosynechococcus sp. M55_K2018_012 TaxID=2747809 RepID=UPI0019D93C91|nr:thiamine phosphate synthase [Thermosynechococcus sp. M55_K2018_012]HIK48743.1 thiamine phosphate synthase [Thermosynechococcus sp. M55_K2018_012]
MQNLAPEFKEHRIWRILDANLDRAREGLRVIEEWYRFVCEDAKMSARCKDLRQRIGRYHTLELRAARHTDQDPGTALSHLQERTRKALSDVLIANFARVQEALRVIEEYGKLTDIRPHPRNYNLSQVAKDLRYEVYILEQELIRNLLLNPRYARVRQLQGAKLYLVTAPSDRLLETVEAALKGGLSLVQYRDKTSDDHTRLTTACQLQALCQRYGALFLVNDRVDIAVAANADGVHLGQTDIPMELARQVLGPDRLVGRSTSNPEELERAIAEGADYVAVGPIFATPTKPDKAAVGFDYLQYAREHAPMPQFAIGGIDLSNIDEVVKAGATQVAVVRAIMDAADPEATTREFLRRLS